MLYRVIQTKLLQEPVLAQCVMVTNIIITTMALRVMMVIMIKIVIMIVLVTMVTLVIMYNMVIMVLRVEMVIMVKMIIMVEIIVMVEDSQDRQNRETDMDGWIDGFTSGYRVATALRIVYWPTPFLTGLAALRSGWLFQLTIPPKVKIAEKA